MSDSEAPVLVSKEGAVGIATLNRPTKFNCISRELAAGLLDAVRQLERGVATTHDIDVGMVLGCAHPMGPLALCDFVGIDTLHRIAEIMYQEYREERYAPPPLLRRLLSMGRLGRKSGAGFYDWSGPEPVALPV